MKTHKNGPRTISFLAGVLCLLIPIPSNAFFGVNSLGEANDLKFKPGFAESTDYLSSNTTFERAKFSYEEVVVKATENVLEMVMWARITVTGRNELVRAWVRTLR